MATLKGLWSIHALVLGSGRIKMNLVQTDARELICNTLAKFTISNTRCECTFRYTITMCSDYSRSHDVLNSGELSYLCLRSPGDMMQCSLAAKDSAALP